jgi:hypothetical protein
MKRFLKNLLAVFAISLIIISVITLFLGAISNVDDEKALKDKTQLENALKNAAVSCYAIEGAYPPSVEYLIANYSVQVDEERFVVKYEFYGSNLMPDITVLVRRYE